MSATIKDIAKAAGVSISTVSRVLTSSQTVDQEKKERVMKAVREMNYVPNNNARNLRRMFPGQSKWQPFLSRDVADPWYTGDFTQTWQDIVEGCQRILEECNG